MYRIRGNFWIKAGAVLLLTAFVLLFITAMVGTVYISEHPNVRLDDNWFQSTQCTRLLRLAAEHAYNLYLYCGEFDFGLQRGWLNQVYCVIQTADGRELASDIYAPPIENAGHIHTYTAGDLVVKTYVDRDLAYALNGAGMEKLLFDFAKAGGDYLTAAVFVSFFAGVGLFVFLCLAAGHRRGREEVVLNPLDRIPYDLYLAGACLTVGLGALFAQEMSYSTEYGVVQTLLLMDALVCYAVLLGAVMTTVTRLKAGGFWRNTLIWRLGGRLWRWFRKWGRTAFGWLGARCGGLFGGVFGFLGGLFGDLRGLLRSLPLIWKAALASLAVVFGELLIFLLGVAARGAVSMVLFVFLVFNVLVLLVVWRLTLDMQKLEKAGERLAEGDQDERVDTSKMLWDFKKHGEALNSIAQGISRAVEKQMRSERMKTELITNVSHDIKTPLTSIVNYVDLLKKEELTGKAAEYVEVLDRQSARLKKLTEDLVEASKASTGNISVNLTRTDVGEIARQAAGEYTERLEKARLELVMNIPDPAPYIMADGRLLWRIIDNLLSNVCKYSQSGTRVYMDVRRAGGKVSLAVKNISRDMLNIDPEELTERFVRGDLSRNTEGSGLGLNIARSLTELQNGSFTLTVDGDLFKAELCFNEQ